MQLHEKTRKYHSDLADFAKTGNLNEIPGIHNKHIYHYRRLVRNIFNDNISSSYPLTKNLFSKDEWSSAVDDFMKNHANQSPQVWYMPKEFYEYVADSRKDLQSKYPFLNELMWMEWLEVELYMMSDISANFKPDGDINKDKIVLNPESQLEMFKYPVHLKNAKQISENDAGEYYLVMFREPETGKINFMNLSPIPARIIELLTVSNLTVRELVDQLQKDIQGISRADLEQGINQFIQNSVHKKLILGYS